MTKKLWTKAALRQAPFFLVKWVPPFLMHNTIYDWMLQHIQVAYMTLKDKNARLKIASKSRVCRKVPAIHRDELWCNALAMDFEKKRIQETRARL